MAKNPLTINSLEQKIHIRLKVVGEAPSRSGFEKGRSWAVSARNYYSPTGRGCSPTPFSDSPLGSIKDPRGWRRSEVGVGRKSKSSEKKQIPLSEKLNLNIQLSTHLSNKTCLNTYPPLGSSLVSAKRKYGGAK